MLLANNVADLIACGDTAIVPSWAVDSVTPWLSVLCLGVSAVVVPTDSFVEVPACKLSLINKNNKFIEFQDEFLRGQKVIGMGTSPYHDFCIFWGGGGGLGLQPKKT